jgi:DNA-directed RNA polymerase specialized sigma24 family protein
MSSDDPITLWIEKLRTADTVAAQHLWDHFVGRLYELGRTKLRFETRRVYDEEDAALSAFHSVCTGIITGQFPDLRDRRGLWQLLVVITARKVAHRQRYDRQQRRDVRRNRAGSVRLPAGPKSTAVNLDTLPSREPTAEFVVEFVETFQHLFEDLHDLPLQQVVELRMQGHSDTEIADQLNCSRRTVQRRLEIIRRRWEPTGGAF